MQGSPLIHRALACGALLGTLSGPGSALAPAGDAGTQPSASRSASPGVLAAAGLRHARVERLALPDPADTFGFDLPLHGAELRVELALHSDRAPGFQLIVQGEDGELRSIDPAPPATFRGHVVGYPDSAVAASRIDGRLRATVRLAPDLAPIGVEPLDRLDASAASDEYLVYDGADSLPLPEMCGVDSVASSVGALPIESLAPGSTAAGGATDEAQIAFDADFEFFQKTNSDAFTTQLTIEATLNSVEAIYEPQTGLVYEITAILVRTTSADPYTTTSPGGLLNQFENHWSSSQGAIARDQSHLMTGRNLDGGVIGIAELNSICGNNRGYGLSESLFQGANELTSVGLTAHELGHNWNATHCDGQSDCGIMCSQIGACAGSVTQFGTQSVNRIVNKKNSSSCLTSPSPAAPILSGPASPSSVSAFFGGTVSIPGSQLGEVTEVRVDGVPLPDVKWTAAFGELRIINALFSEAGTVDIEVENAAGSDGGVSLDIVPATGIALNGPGLSIPGASTSFEWTVGAGNTYFFNFAFDGLTTPVGGFDILANANVGIIGTAGSGGTGGFFIPSAGSLGFVNISLQVLAFDGGSASFLGASDVLTTLFL